MQLDGKDIGGEYDPFAMQQNVKLIRIINVLQRLDLVLQAQGHFMNKDSTQGNAFWTPEYQQQMEQLKKQQLEQ